MADVFIAYKREDQARVEQLRAALAQAGVTVWFDAYLEIGADWRPQVARAIERARAMIVCWTPAACASAYVTEEARAGFERSVLAPVRFEACEIPAPFDATHALDLSSWNGEIERAEFVQLLHRIERLIGRTDIARRA